MSPQSTYTKRTTESLDLPVLVAADKLGTAVVTAGSAVVSPSGLTLGTVSPISDGVNVNVSSGTTDTQYAVTVTITLSDTRTITEVVAVYVLDESIEADPTVSVDDNPPSVCLTNRKSAEAFLGRMGVSLRLDTNTSGGVDPVERREIVRGAYVATDWVRMHLMGYADDEVAKSFGAWNWATIYYCRWLCLREGNPIPPGLHELYVEAEKHLREIQAGTKFLADIESRLDPEPSWSNLRIDHVYAEKKLRVQKQTSDSSHAGFRRKQDTQDRFRVEPDY